MLKDIIKSIIPRTSINWSRDLLLRMDIFLATSASKTRVTSALYYLIASNEFVREMYTVLQARGRYYQSKSGFKPTSYLIRRNIHRLEKGLCMRPRRAIFGEGYIEETVGYLVLCDTNEVLLGSELEWAHSVLREYFLRVEMTATIQRARVRFEDHFASNRDEQPNFDKKPKKYSRPDSVNMAYRDLRLLCERRSSIRFFQPRPVSKELVDAALDVAATAPSACNRQPFKFYIFDEPEKAQLIGSIPNGTAGFSHTFQCIVVVVADLSAYPFEKDRHIIYIDSALAVMQFQLALETLGLNSCTINWPDVEHLERQMSEELKLMPFEKTVMLVAVGYAEGTALVPFSSKKTAVDLAIRPK